MKSYTYNARCAVVSEKRAHFPFYPFSTTTHTPPLAICGCINVKHAQPTQRRTAKHKSSLALSLFVVCRKQIIQKDPYASILSLCVCTEATQALYIYTIFSTAVARQQYKRQCYVSPLPPPICCVYNIKFPTTKIERRARWITQSVHFIYNHRRYLYSWSKVFADSFKAHIQRHTEGIYTYNSTRLIYLAASTRWWWRRRAVVCFFAAQAVVWCAMVALCFCCGFCWFSFVKTFSIIHCILCKQSTHTFYISSLWNLMCM